MMRTSHVWHYPATTGAPPRLSSHDLPVTADGVLVSPTVWSQLQASMHEQLLHRSTGHVAVASAHSASKAFLALCMWHFPNVCASRTNAEHNSAEVGHSQLHWLCAAATRTLGPPFMQRIPVTTSIPNNALPYNLGPAGRYPSTKRSYLVDRGPRVSLAFGRSAESIGACDSSSMSRL